MIVIAFSLSHKLNIELIWPGNDGRKHQKHVLSLSKRLSMLFIPRFALDYKDETWKIQKGNIAVRHKRFVSDVFLHLRIILKQTKI